MQWRKCSQKEEALGFGELIHASSP
jgi:hypothetical protein